MERYNTGRTMRSYVCPFVKCGRAFIDGERLADHMRTFPHPSTELREATVRAAYPHGCVWRQPADMQLPWPRRQVSALAQDPKASAGEESASDGAQPSKRKREADDAAGAADAAQDQGKASDDGDGALSAGSADSNRRRSVSSARRRYPGTARRASTPA